MDDVLAVILVIVGLVLALLGPRLARRLVRLDEGDRSSKPSIGLGLGAGRWWELYRLAAIELVAIAFVVTGALALFGVWDPTQ